MSAYRIAIDLTTKTIDSRAKFYRNLIVAVVALGAISLACAAATRTLSLLTGLLMLLPTCGFFFFLDDRLLRKWRSGLFHMWVRKELDFNAFHHAVEALPKLPKDTLHGMLATLPSAQDLVAEQQISSSTREAIAATAACIYGYQSDTLVIKATGAAIGSISIILAATLRTWKPIWGCIILVLLPFSRTWLNRWRATAMNQSTLAAREQSDFNEQKYRELIESLEIRSRRQSGT
jgi:hypothetical protein